MAISYRYRKYYKDTLPPPEHLRMKYHVYNHRHMILMQIPRTEWELRLWDWQDCLRRPGRRLRALLSPYNNIRRLCRLLNVNWWWVLHPITTYLIWSSPIVTPRERRRLCSLFHRRK